MPSDAMHGKYLEGLFHVVVKACPGRCVVNGAVAIDTRARFATDPQAARPSERESPAVDEVCTRISPVGFIVWSHLTWCVAALQASPKSARRYASVKTDCYQ